MAQPIVVEGADGRRFEFPEGTSPEVMREALQKYYGRQGPEVSEPQRISPMESSLASQGFTPEQSLDEGVVAMRGPDGIIYESTQGAEGIAAGYQARAPKRARREAKERLNRQFLGLPKAAAAIYTGADDLTLGSVSRGINALDYAIGGFEDGEQGGYAARRYAQDEYPVSSMAGSMAAYAVPAHLSMKAGNAFANIPAARRVTDAVGRMGRLPSYGGRLATLGVQGAAGYGGYVANTEANNQEASQGSSVSLGERFGMGAEAMTEPSAFAALPVMSAAYRVGRKVSGKTFAPDSVNARVSRNLGRAPASGALGKALDTAFANGVSADVLGMTERILRRSGLSGDDVATVSSRASEILQGSSGRLTAGMALAQALEGGQAGGKSFAQAAENLMLVLRGQGLTNRSGLRIGPIDRQNQSGSIIQTAAKDARASQAGFLEGEAMEALGSRSRLDVEDLVKSTKSEIGKTYEDVLAKADAGRPEADQLRALVSADPSANAVLRRKAKNVGLSVEQFIIQRPDEAAHWLRSHLAKAARSAQGRERVDLLDTVEQLDELLDTNPGYASARKRFGTEADVERAGDFGRDFNSISKDPAQAERLVRDFESLPKRSQEVALLSIRDQVRKVMRGGKEEARGRIAGLDSIGTLDTLEQIPGGKRLADAIRSVRKENQFFDSISPDVNSRTVPNAVALRDGPSLTDGPTSQALQKAGNAGVAGAKDIAVSHLTGAFAPIFLGQSVASGLGAVFRPRGKTLEDFSRFMVTPVRGNALATPKSAPPTGGRGTPLSDPSRLFRNRSMGARAGGASIKPPAQRMPK